MTTPANHNDQFLISKFLINIKNDIIIIDSVDGTTRYYFTDGTMLDVADTDRDKLVRDPDPETDSVR